MVSLGGFQNVDQDDSYPWLAAERKFLLEAHARSVPVLGVCLGAQLLAQALGGEVGPVEAGPEIGTFDVERTPHGARDDLFGVMPDRFPVMQCHGYQVTSLPDEASSLLSSTRTPVQAYRVGASVGVQFHPEWSRDAFAAVLESNRDWARSAGYSWDALSRGATEWFSGCRQAGDRLLEEWLDRVHAST